MHYYTDINECNTNNGGCEHTCTNVDGSNICSCDEGYTLDSNGNSCTGKWVKGIRPVNNY